MVTSTHPAFLYDDDSSWTELRSWLTFQVSGQVFNSHISDWQGQENEIIDDIVSESIIHLIERLEKANAGNADPIDTLYPFARQVAFHCFIDLVRKDGRKVRFSQISSECEEGAGIELILPGVEDATLNAVYYEQLCKLIAREIVTFPEKQKKAMLRDHAKRILYMADPLPLLRAYEGVGIQLTDYLNYAPTNEVEKRRHSSLLHCAYQRLACCPSVQRYIGGMVKKSA
jgi:hypothetical protein